jgi:hypothetical protein
MRSKRLSMWSIGWATSVCRDGLARWNAFTAGQRRHLPHQQCRRASCETWCSGQPDRFQTSTAVARRFWPFPMCTSSSGCAANPEDQFNRCVAEHPPTKRLSRGIRSHATTGPRSVAAATIRPSSALDCRRYRRIHLDLGLRHMASLTNSPVPSRAQPRSCLH